MALTGARKYNVKRLLFHEDERNVRLAKSILKGAGYTEREIDQWIKDHKAASAIYTRSTLRKLWLERPKGFNQSIAKLFSSAFGEDSWVNKKWIRGEEAYNWNLADEDTVDRTTVNPGIRTMLQAGYNRST